MTRRLGVGLAALVIGAVAVSVAALAVCGTAGAQGGSGAPRTALAQNRAAAHADATVMLAQITLPAGATPLRVPARPPVISADPAAALAEARWSVPGESMRQALAEVESHQPHEVISTGTGYGADASGLTSLDVMYTLKVTQPDEIAQRIIEVTAVPAASGSTVTVESESVWVVPRSAASAIPATSRRITLSVKTPEGRPLRSVTLTGRRAGEVRSFFDGLEADQPGTIACPAELPGNLVTVTFRRRLGARPVAVASWSDPSEAGAGECNPVGLTVDGRRQDSLLSPTYIRSLQRLFGVSIPTGTAPITGPVRR